jgi:hypothetical protein
MIVSTRWARGWRHDVGHPCGAGPGGGGRPRVVVGAENLSLLIALVLLVALIAPDDLLLAATCSTSRRTWR